MDTVVGKREAQPCLLVLMEKKSFTNNKKIKK